MNNFMFNYFGPLPQKYCVYFYFLSIFFGIIFAISILSIVSFIVFNQKKLNSLTTMNLILFSINSFIVYFVNRLLHTMCVRSL